MGIKNRSKSNKVFSKKLYLYYILTFSKNKTRMWEDMEANKRKEIGWILLWVVGIVFLFGSAGCKEKSAQTGQAGFPSSKTGQTTFTNLGDLAVIMRPVIMRAVITLPVIILPVIILPVIISL